MKNGLLVNFSCNTCPWVVAWQDRYNALAEESNKNKIGFITVNPNTAWRDLGENLSDMREFAKENGHDFLYALDKEAKLATAFGATKTPHIYLFNGEGKLVYRGAIDDNARRPQKVKNKYYNELIKMGEIEHEPYETILHNIYDKEKCFSPIPSLAIHCTNVNSIFGLSPTINFKKLWEDSKL